MTAGIVNGKMIGLYVGNELIAYAKSHKLSVKMATRDATSKDSGSWSEKLEGLLEWSVTGDSLFAFDAIHGVSELFESMTGRTKVSVKLSTEVTGDLKFSGEAFITALDLDAPNEENTTYSYSLEGTGPLTKTTITLP